MNNLKELKDLLENPKKIAIVSHRNPDGDALGSTLALYHYLKKFDHKVQIAYPSSYPEVYGWMEGVERAIIHDSKPAETNLRIGEAELIFCLDFNTLARIDKLGEAVGNNPCPKVLIDHHLNPDDFPTFSLHDAAASSTCELIFDFIEMMGHKPMIDETIGDCIFTGILTDTGSFQYSTSAKLYRIAGELKAMGIDDNKLQNLTFNCLSIKQLQLLGHCLTAGLQIIPEFSTGIIRLNMEDYRRFNIQRGDTEGIVNNILRIKQMKVAALIMERDGFVKMSLRSKGDFSVQEIASKYFDGGGHLNASGGTSKLGIDATIKKFIDILPTYADQLQPA